MQRTIIAVIIACLCLINAPSAYAYCVDVCPQDKKNVLEYEGFCYRVKGKKQVIIVHYSGPGGHVIIPPVIDGLSVTQIDKKAFYDCDEITKVTIPFSVVKIGQYAFYDCDNLRCVLISDSVKIIKKAAFYHCDRLTWVLLGNNVRKIQKEAFCECPMLAEVYFRGAAPKIGKFVFCKTDERLNICLNYCITGCVSDDDCEDGFLCSCAALFECVDETLVTLGGFEAIWEQDSVIVTWLTDAEIDNAYFNIYRADDEAGPYVKINPVPIPAQGIPPAGAAYQYVDATVVSGSTYWYKLEAVDIYAVSTEYGPCGPVSQEFSCSYLP